MVHPRAFLGGRLIHESLPRVPSPALTVTRTRRTPISVELYGETVVIGYRESTRTVPATKPRSFTTSAKWRAESKARANQLAREARPDPAVPIRPQV